MKRFGIWQKVGCKLLKFAALYMAFNTIMGIGQYMAGSPGLIRYGWLGTTFHIDPLFYFILSSAWHVTQGFAHSFLLWVAADVIELIFNNSAYTRAIYAALRKQAKQQPYIPPQAYIQHQQPQHPPVHIPPLFDERDFRTVPISQSYQPQTVQRAPMRRVTVFRNRADHAERPPRPAGTIEIIESLDDTQEIIPNPLEQAEVSYLPFDKV